MSAPPLTKAEILELEAVDFISESTVNAALYAVSFTLYWLCVSAHYRQLKTDPDRRKRTIVTLAIMSIIAGCGFGMLAILVQETRIQYIDHGDYPLSQGGPYFYDGFRTLPLSGAGYALVLITECFTMGIPIWRLWIIWSTSRYTIAVVILPFLLYLTYNACTIALIVSIYHGNLLSPQTKISLVTAGMSLTFAGSFLTSILIIARIASIRKRHINLWGKSDNVKQYTTMIAMLVESFSLDLAWTLAATVCSVLSVRDQMAGLAQNIITNSGPFIRIIAYFLVMYRVSTGRGWESQTERHLTTLRFNLDEPEMTKTFSTEVSYSRSRV